MLRVSGRSMLFANTWLLLLFSGLICWMLAVGGSDILAMNVVVLVLYLFVERHSLGSVSVLSIVIAVLVGLFATSRIVMPLLAPLFGLIIWKHNRVGAVVFTLVALAVAAGVHAIAYVQSDYYHPFHLIGRGEERTGPVLMAVGLAATALVMLAALVWMKQDQTSRLGWFVLVLATPFAFIAAGELIDTGFDVSAWEGANYLVPVAAVLVYYILLKAGVDQNRPDATEGTGGRERRLRYVQPRMAPAGPPRSP